MSSPTDQTIDLLVIGAGAAGMTAALVGTIEGLQVLLCEKADQVGGTTATSAGTVWVPGSSQSNQAGVPDTTERARQYLDSVIGRPADDHLRSLRETFLETGPLAIDYLEAKTDVAFVAAAAHPDYLSNHPGAAYGGRALNALPFDGRLLGKDFARVRPARPELMVLGGMMVAKADIPALLKPFASGAHFLHAARLLLRHGGDRLRYPRGTRLVMGNALVARLFASLRKQATPVLFGTKLADLLFENGRVVGAVVAGPGGHQTIHAKRGVILATGGVGWNRELRKRLFPANAQEHSLAPASSTGDGLEAAERLGATLEHGPGTGGLWMPVSSLKGTDGQVSLFPHIILDRAKPGLLAVNRTGRRFANEADSYHAFVEAMIAADDGGPGAPAYLICDRSFIKDYGIGFIHPGTRNLKPFLAVGYLVQGADTTTLANAIGVDAEALTRTIADYNRYAVTGMDEAFGRGGSDLNRFNGNSANKPNPCMRPVGPGPLFAVAVQPADLASSSGLRVDADARVQHSDGTPIVGLYACGNDSTSIFEGTYPGPGTTLGPALVFGWRAAMHAAHATL